MQPMLFVKTPKGFEFSIGGIVGIIILVVIYLFSGVAIPPWLARLLSML